MSREIKFRACVPSKKTMYDPFKLDWLKSNVENPEGFKPNEFIGWPTDAIFLEFTGLKDKNGKEIYEGDIVKTGEVICEIIWEEKYSAFRAKIGMSLTERINAYVFEVIGNIYENGELLNPGKE